MPRREPVCDRTRNGTGGRAENAWIASTRRTRPAIRCGTRQKGIGNESADSGPNQQSMVFQ